MVIVVAASVQCALLLLDVQWVVAAMWAAESKVKDAALALPVAVARGLLAPRAAPLARVRVHVIRESLQRLLLRVGVHLLAVRVDAARRIPPLWGAKGQEVRGW